MMIEFFNNGNCLDERAAGGGVFKIEAGTEGGEKVVLYVSESSNMLEKAGRLLKILKADPEYLGLSKGYMGLDNLVLKFSVEQTVPVRKTLSTMGVYRDAEVNVIKNLKPVTQHAENRMLLTEGKRCLNVRDALKTAGIE